MGPVQLIQNQPVNGKFGVQVGGTSVSINGVAAPILYSSATQVAGIVPYSVTGSTAQVTLTYQGQNAAPFLVSMAPSAPSLFTTNQSGSGQAAAINAASGIVNSATNPVAVGGYISLYATGGGQTSPAGSNGSLAGATAPRPILPVSATVGGLPAAVQYAGGAPGLVEGLMQVNVQIPSGVQTGGYVPVVLTVGTTSSGPGVWIAVSAK